MALNRYTLTANVLVPAGTITTPIVAGEPGTGGASGYGDTSTSAGIGYYPQTFLQGTTIVLDPAGQVYAAITAVNASALAAYRDGIDNVGHAGLGN